MKFSGSVAVGVAAVFGFAAVQGQGLPQVDLGYEIHQAADYNATGQYYNFSNIRYAQAPTGDLRFARPVPPDGRNPTVQTGNQSVICPQASPVWQLIAAQFSAAFANGSLDSFNYSTARNIAMSQLAAAQASASSPDSRMTEDCLFLDVMVPKAAYDAKGTGTGAPVIVWIYGGGYVLGSKTSSGNPAGLIYASYNNGGGGNYSAVNGTNSTTSYNSTSTNSTSSGNSTGVIFVAMNYRLGALGWLSGPSFQLDGGVSNAALYDQRLAIQWVRQYIQLFGGDPNRITLMGESAGGGSIMHQVTAYGGCKGVNFQRAIIQSPGWFPISSEYVQENTTQTFYQLLNVSDLAGARAANTSAIIRANAMQVGASIYGTYTYGPAVDGVFVPAQPGLLLGIGQYADQVQLMMGHNVNEGVFFAPAYVQSDADLANWLMSEYPYSSPQVGAYLLNTLYPADYSGKYNYTSPVTRAIRIITEQIFTCNTNYLARAAKNMTYNYEFQVPPSLHGFDVAYTFYNGDNNGVNAAIAKTMQGYFVNFAATGNPNGNGLPTFKMQGPDATMLGLNVSGITNQPDDTANARCKYFQKYLYT